MYVLDAQDRIQITTPCHRCRQRFPRPYGSHTKYCSKKCKSEAANERWRKSKGNREGVL